MSSLPSSRWIGNLQPELHGADRRRGGISWWVAASVTVATVSVAAIAYFGLCNRRQTLDDEKVKQILSELTRQFYVVCRDVAQIARTVRPRIKAEGVEINEETLRMQLQKQCKVFEKLEEIQCKVTAQFGCQPEDVQKAQERAAQNDDPEMQAYCRGFSMMLDDALNGTVPIMPNLQVPEGLTKEKVLEIEHRAHALEVQKILDKVGSNAGTLQEITGMMVQAQTEGLAEALLEFADVFPGDADFFRAATAVYERDPDFCKDRRKMEEKHNKRLVKLFQPGGVAAVKP
mmetsp:Transcript_21867/g.49850  ORF Transcript_21867/g.49850 Transcript_21867/m.49850 type:complete len:288 (+) Transcript_21867:56-919(+)